MTLIADDNFLGSSLEPWWDQFQSNLLATLTVQSGYLQGTLTQAGVNDGLWFNNSSGFFLGQAVQGDFDICCEFQCFDDTFAGLPTFTGNPKLVGVSAHDIVRTPTGTGPRGAVISNTLNYHHRMSGFAPGMDNGNALSDEWKYNINSVSTWNTIVHPSVSDGHMWGRIRRVGTTIDSWRAAASGAPGSGAVPQGASWTNQITQVQPLLGNYMRVGVQMYSNAASPALGARWYRILNYREE